MTANQTRVLLTVEHQLQSQLLKNALLARGDVELVGESKCVVDSLMLIASQRPDLWIHTIGDDSDFDASLSHAYDIHPGLAVARVHANEPNGILQMQVSSISQLIRVTHHTRSLLDQPGPAVGSGSL